MVHRLLQAPTVAITRMLQRDIVVWLSEVGRQGHLRGLMTLGPASVTIIPMLLPVTWVTICLVPDITCNSIGPTTIGRREICLRIDRHGSPSNKFSLHSAHFKTRS